MTFHFALELLWASGRSATRGHGLVNYVPRIAPFLDVHCATYRFSAAHTALGQQATFEMKGQTWDC